MDIKLHPTNFDADKRLTGYVTKKINVLAKYNKSIVDAEVYLKLNNQGIKNKTVEIKINIPGHQLFSSDDAKKFETACNRASDHMARQLRKLKTRLTKGRS